MEAVHASFSARKGTEKNFLNSGGIQSAVFTIVEVLLSCGMHFSCIERPVKQFSPIWSLIEACACLFNHTERHSKQFSQLWWPCEAHACLFVRFRIERIFNHCQGPVKLLHASLCVRKDVETSFHHYGCPAKLVQASFGVMPRKCYERHRK